MTYQEALQARARLAYSKNALTKIALKIDKKAEQDPIEAKLSEGAGNSDKGNGVPAPTREQELEGMLAERNNQLDTTTQDYNNLRYGLGAGGAGLAAGAGIGAATYGLTGLFPSLKKRRLLRALIALGAGGAGGAGLGYLTYGGLQSGKVQDMANKGLEKGKELKDKAVSTAKDAYNYVKNKVNPPDPNAEAKAKGLPYAVPAKEQKKD